MFGAVRWECPAWRGLWTMARLNNGSCLECSSLRCVVFQIARWCEIRSVPLERHIGFCRSRQYYLMGFSFFLWVFQVSNGWRWCPTHTFHKICLLPGPAEHISWSWTRRVDMTQHATPECKRCSSHSQSLSEKQHNNMNNVWPWLLHAAHVHWARHRRSTRQWRESASLNVESR